MADAKDANLACVDALMLRCQQTELYGVVQLIVKRGLVVHVEVSQTLKPADLVSGAVSPIQLVPESNNGATQTNDSSHAG